MIIKKNPDALFAQILGWIESVKDPIIAHKDFDTPQTCPSIYSESYWASTEMEKKIVMRLEKGLLSVGFSIGQLTLFLRGSLDSMVIVGLLY